MCSVLQAVSERAGKCCCGVLLLADEGFSHLIMQVQYYITGELGCLQ